MVDTPTSPPPQEGEEGGGRGQGSGGACPQSLSRGEGYGRMGPSPAAPTSPPSSNSFGGGGRLVQASIQGWTPGGGGVWVGGSGRTPGVGGGGWLRYGNMAPPQRPPPPAPLRSGPIPPLILSCCLVPPFGTPRPNSFLSNLTVSLPKCLDG